MKEVCRELLYGFGENRYGGMLGQLRYILNRDLYTELVSHFKMHDMCNAYDVAANSIDEEYTTIALKYITRGTYQPIRYPPQT